MPELENLSEEALFDDIGEKSLRRILESMVSTIEGSKSQIFDVYEAAHSEVESSKKNLQDAKRLTQEVIDEVDALEEQEQQEKQKLVLVSSSFSDYSEEKIQEAYESVKNVHDLSFRVPALAKTNIGITAGSIGHDTELLFEHCRRDPPA